MDDDKKRKKEQAKERHQQLVAEPVDETELSLKAITHLINNEWLAANELFSEYRQDI